MGFEQSPPTDVSLVQQLKYAQESGAIRHHASTRRMCVTDGVSTVYRKSARAPSQVCL